MSKHDFSVEEFAERRRRVRQAMTQAELDWLVVFSPVSMHWLTGAEAKSYQAFQCLLLSAQGDKVTILTREAERHEFEDDALVDEVLSWGGSEPEDPLEAFERLIRARGIPGTRVGIEVPPYYLHPHHYVRVKEMLGSSLVAEPTNLVHHLKLVKSATEIAYIRRAASIADEAMNAFVNSLAAGRSELELAGVVYSALLSRASGFPASTLNLVSGPRAGYAHGAPTERRLAQGDTGNIEYGAAYRRYTATIGRQFCIGRPTERLMELFDVVREASRAMIAEIRAGVPAVNPHNAAKRVIAEAGYDRFRIHTSGYGLAPGFPPSWGEPIQMFGGSSDTLEAGMVLSVEPPIFIGNERVGVRVIDNVLVTPTGAEVLSNFSSDIIVVGGDRHSH
jgi:Xaa-Pro dipeptidase